MCQWNNESINNISCFVPTRRISLNSISDYNFLRDIQQMMVHSKILCLNVLPSNPNPDRHGTKIRMDRASQFFLRFFVIQTSTFPKHNQFVLSYLSEANLKLPYPLQNPIRKGVTCFRCFVLCFFRIMKLFLVDITLHHISHTL
mgnify:CR=1 FL=1